MWLIAVQMLGGFRAAVFALLAALALSATGVQTLRLHYAQDAAKRAADSSVAAALAASEAARAEEQTRARYIAGVADAYDKGKADAQAQGERVAAELRAGNLQLRQRWQGCEARHVPGAPAGTVEPDAGADDRAESAGRIVRAAAECDAQVRGLQALIEADRK